MALMSHRRLSQWEGAGGRGGGGVIRRRRVHRPTSICCLVSATLKRAQSIKQMAVVRDGLCCKFVSLDGEQNLNIKRGNNLDAGEIYASLDGALPP